MTEDDINAVFLALMTYREARGSGPLAQLAVAYTAVVRAKHGGWWGGDLLSVIGKPWQYSSMAAPGDPQLTVWPHINDPAWESCLQAAETAIFGSKPNPGLGADSYFDISIEAPAWAHKANFVIQIGRLKFYRTISS